MNKNHNGKKAAKEIREINDRSKHPIDLPAPVYDKDKSPESKYPQFKSSGYIFIG